MEIFGFACAVALLVLLTFAWAFVLVFDGALGAREIPVWCMLIAFSVILFAWFKVMQWMPFTVVAN